MAEQNGTAIIEEEAERRGSRRGVSWPATFHPKYWQISDPIPPWWSRARDVALDGIISRYDHIGGLVYATSTKLANIPLKFVPKNPSITAHVDLAEKFTAAILTNSGYGQGFRTEYKEGIYDLLSMDNGLFFEVMGDEEVDKPLTGMAWGIRHLDSINVTRTGDILYPVTYDDPERGGRWKYHMSRVIALSQMPSSRKRMNGVGRAAVGRSCRIGEILSSQITYKLEQMGSRPTNEILALIGGEASDLVKYMMLSDEIMDSLGLTRFRKAIAMGLPLNGDIKRIRLNDFVNFDEEIGTTMGMFALAYIWGMDIRDFWPVAGSKQGNEITNMAARGRLPTEFIQDMGEQLTLKVCPPVLEAIYDYQDDEEDQSKALSRDIRARYRERHAKAGIIDAEAERRLMVIDGDLTREEFVRMQLNSGKLEDGTPIATLFYSDDELTAALLAIPGITNPLLFRQNEARTVLGAIEERKALCYEVLAVGGRKNKQKATQALAALTWLEGQYDKPEPQPVEIKPSTVKDVAEAVERDPDNDEEE